MDAYFTFAKLQKFLHISIEIVQMKLKLFFWYLPGNLRGVGLARYCLWANSSTMATIIQFILANGLDVCLQLETGSDGATAAVVVEVDAALDDNAGRYEAANIRMSRSLSADQKYVCNAAGGGK